MGMIRHDLSSFVAEWSKVGPAYVQCEMEKERYSQEERQRNFR